MLRIEYDNEAVQVEKLIHRRLQELGLEEFVEGAIEAREEMEVALLDTLRAAREDIRSGRLESAIERLLLPGQRLRPPASSLPSEITREELLGALRLMSTTARDALVPVLLETLSAVAPGDVYRPSFPLNVAAALDSLFQAIVVPRRLFADASKRCADSLRADLVVEDEDGNVAYDREALASSDREEVAFWELVDLVVDRWSIRSQVSPRVVEPRAIRHYSDVAFNAIGLVNNLLLERVS